MRVIYKIVSNLAFVVFMALCVSVITVTVLFAMKIVSPLVVVSGSMEPTIRTGSLMVSVPQKTAEMDAGQIASLQREDGVWVTHRIISVDLLSGDTTGQRVITMKGDANKEKDGKPYIQNEGLRPIAVIPGAGSAYAYVNDHKLFILAGAFFFAAGVIWVKFLTRRKPQEDDNSAGPTDGHDSSAVEKNDDMESTDSRA